MRNAPLAHDYFRGALPLLPFGQFTPGYLQEDDGRGQGAVSRCNPVTRKAGKGTGRKANPFAADREPSNSACLCRQGSSLLRRYDLAAQDYALDDASSIALVRLSAPRECRSYHLTKGMNFHTAGNRHRRRFPAIGR